MVLHYFRITFRTMRKYSRQSLIGICGLAIGLLTFMLCNYYVQYHLFYNTQIPNADRIYKLTSTLTENELKNNFPEIEKMLPISKNEISGISVNYAISIDDKDVSSKGIISIALHPSFVDFFSLRLIHGNKEMITRTDNGLVLFESSAKKLTNDIGSLIGKEFKLENDKIFYITGILTDPPDNSQLGISKHFFFHLTQNPADNPMKAFISSEKSNSFFVQLYKNASKRSFLTKLENHFNKEPAEKSYEIKPYTGLSNFGEYNKNIFKFLFVFGFLILLSTLSNFILFRISLYYNRLKEYGIRIVNGVNGLKFTWQLYVDIATQFLLSCFIVFFVLETFFSTFEKTYYQFTYIHLHLPTLREQLMSYFLYGMLLSLLFSMVLSRILLRLSGRSVFGNLLHKNKQNIANGVLLFIQLSVITVFISASGIVKLQVDRMKSSIFSNLTQSEQENILYFRCDYSQLYRQYDVLTQKIKNSNDVLDITGSNIPIFIPSGYAYFAYLEMNDFEDQKIQNYQVSVNFFTFFKGQTLFGDASENAMNDEDAVIVNKHFMKLFPDESIIGKTFSAKRGFSSDNRMYRIVGVVDNIQVYSVELNEGVEEVSNIAEKEPLIFSRLSESRASNDFYVKFKSGKLKETKQHIETCLREFILESAEIKFATLQEQVDSSFKSEKLISFSSVILFFISLILGLLNIYSSVMMSVEKRKKEIAIRKINGAGVKDIILLMGKSYFILWTLACLVSFPFIYFFAIRWLERYRDPVSLNILLFVVIYVVILLFIALTVLSQIIKTVKSNPAEEINK